MSGRFDWFGPEPDGISSENHVTAFSSALRLSSRVRLGPWTRYRQHTQRMRGYRRRRRGHLLAPLERSRRSSARPDIPRSEGRTARLRRPRYRGCVRRIRRCRSADAPRVGSQPAEHWRSCRLRWYRPARSPSRYGSARRCATVRYDLVGTVGKDGCHECVAGTRRRTSCRRWRSPAACWRRPSCSSPAAAATPPSGPPGPVRRLRRSRPAADADEHVAGRPGRVRMRADPGHRLGRLPARALRHRRTSRSGRDRGGGIRRSAGSPRRGRCGRRIPAEHRLRP